MKQEEDIYTQDWIGHQSSDLASFQNYQDSIAKLLPSNISRKFRKKKLKQLPLFPLNKKPR